MWNVNLPEWNPSKNSTNLPIRPRNRKGLGRKGGIDEHQPFIKTECRGPGKANRNQEMGDPLESPKVNPPLLETQRKSRGFQ